MAKKTPIVLLRTISASFMENLSEDRVKKTLIDKTKILYSELTGVPSLPYPIVR
jgi:O-acetylhomoserine/O-acetylserine sulfhydrylase-like pyridoxal-dependent enzyme